MGKVRLVMANGAVSGDVDDGNKSCEAGMVVLNEQLDHEVLG